MSMVISMNISDRNVAIVNAKKSVIRVQNDKQEIVAWPRTQRM